MSLNRTPLNFNYLYKVFFFALLLIWTPLSWAEENFYMATWGEYAREVQERAGKGISNTDEFRKHWIQQFNHVLSVPGSPEDAGHRIMILGELGALQVGLGENRDAFETYRRMEQEAKDHSLLPARVDALDSQFDIASRSNTIKEEDTIPLADKVNEAYQELFKGADEQVRNRYMKSYSDSLTKMAETFLARGKQDLSLGEKRNNNQQVVQGNKMLAKSRDFAEMSVSLGSQGSRSEDNKYFVLARVRAELGDVKGAVDAYEKILSSTSTEFSKMYIAQLSLKAQYSADSPEYQEGIQKILETYTTDSYRIPLMQELAMSFIRSDSYEQAIKVLENILEKGENDNVNATNLYLMGRCYIQLKDFDVAKEIFEKIVRKYPGTGAAQASKNMIGLADHELRIIAERFALENMNEFKLSNEARLHAPTSKNVLQKPALNPRSTASQPSFTGKEQLSEPRQLQSSHSSTGIWLTAICGLIIVVGVLYLNVKRKQSCGSKSKLLQVFIVLLWSGNCLAEGLPGLISQDVSSWVDVVTEVQAGVVPYNSKISIGVPIKNRMEIPLFLLFKSSDCGCLSTEKQIMIRPHETKIISMQLNTPFGSKVMDKEIWYELKGPQIASLFRIKVKAKTEPILIDTYERNLGIVNPLEDIQVQFRLLIKEGWKFQGVTLNEGVPYGKIKTLADMVTVYLKMPETGGRFNYEYRTSFEKGNLKADIYGNIFGSVGNPIFSENELFLGNIQKSNKRMTLEKEWLINRQYLVLDSLRIEPKLPFEYTLSEIKEGSGKREDEIHLKVQIPESWKIGMQKIDLIYLAEKKTTDNNIKIQYRTPIKILVLP